MTHVTIAANATAQFALDRLRVEAELVGSKHEFFYEGHRTIVTIPKPNPRVDPYDDRIRCDTWKSVGMVPMVYQVDSLDFEIELPSTLQVPAEVLQRSPNQTNLLSVQESNAFDEKVKNGTTLLERAFSYWLQVLRWKSHIGHIGEPSVRYAGSAGSGALIDRETRHRFWLRGHMVVAVGGQAVNLADWETARKALDAGKRPPVWFDFLFEAKMRMNNLDLIGAVLMLAVAFEVNLRKVFSAEIETFDIDPVVLQVMDLANLRALLTRVKRLRNWNDDWEAATDVSTLHRLMDYRDGVMHLAKTERINEAALREMYSAVENFAYFTTTALGLD